MYSIKYNSSLPVSLEVLAKTRYNKYRLKIGRRILDTRSQKELKVGAFYWANFTSGYEGKLSINRLIQKPGILTQQRDFWELESFENLKSLVLNGEKFHEFICTKLQNAQNKGEFMLATSMLLAQNEGILYLPCKVQNRSFVLQHKLESDEYLYIFDTLAMVKFTHNKVEVLYEKVASLLLEIYQNVQLSDQIALLWKGKVGILDVEG